MGGTIGHHRHLPVGLNNLPAVENKQNTTYNIIDEDLWGIIVQFTTVGGPRTCGRSLRCTARTCKRMYQGVKQAIPWVVSVLAHHIDQDESNDDKVSSWTRELKQIGALAVPHILHWLCPIHPGRCRAATALLKVLGERAGTDAAGALVSALQWSFCVARPHLQREPWACTACTYLNPASRQLWCEVCMRAKPAIQEPLEYDSSPTDPAALTQRLRPSAWNNHGPYRQADRSMSMDTRSQPQYELVCAIGSMPNRATETAIATLVGCLTADTCPSVKQAASHALVKIGERAVSHISPLLHWDCSCNQAPRFEEQVVIRLAAQTLSMMARRLIQIPTSQVREYLQDTNGKWHQWVPQNVRERFNIYF